MLPPISIVKPTAVPKDKVNEHIFALGEERSTYRESLASNLIAVMKFALPLLAVAILLGSATAVQAQSAQKILKLSAALMERTRRMTFASLGL
jgi:hypothetical protein